MQYEAWKFIKLFPNKLPKIQANEVSVIFGFKPCQLRTIQGKENNQNKKFGSRSRVYLIDYPGNFKNVAKIKTIEKP